MWWRRLLGLKVDPHQREVNGALNALWGGRVVVVMWSLFTIGLIAIWANVEPTMGELFWPILVFGGFSYFGLWPARHGKRKLAELADREIKNRKAGIVP